MDILLRKIPRHGEIEMISELNNEGQVVSIGATTKHTMVATMTDKRILKLVLRPNGRYNVMELPKLDGGRQPGEIEFAYDGHVAVIDSEIAWDPYAVGLNMRLYRGDGRRTLDKFGGLPGWRTK